MQWNLRAKTGTGLGVMEMNVGVDVGPQRDVLNSPMNAAYF